MPSCGGAVVLGPLLLRPDQQGFEYTAAPTQRRLRRRRAGRRARPLVGDGGPHPAGRLRHHHRWWVLPRHLPGRHAHHHHRSLHRRRSPAAIGFHRVRPASDMPSTACWGDVRFSSPRQRHRHLRRHADAPPDEDLRILRDLFRGHQRITFAEPVLTPTDLLALPPCWVPKTCATWADALKSAAGSVPRPALGGPVLACRAWDDLRFVGLKLIFLIASVPRRCSGCPAGKRGGRTPRS